MVDRKPIIGVMGGSVCDDEVRDWAHRVGQLIAERGAIVLCGGRAGVMEAVCQGAIDHGGTTIGIMPGGSFEETPPNDYVTIPIYTGMSDGRNAINAKSSDVVIAIDGGAGTLSEIGLALKNGKSVVGLGTWEPKIGGELPPGYITATDPEDAVRKAFEALDRRT
jgi:uncharacterized protein (TIGR00725 family)